MKKVIIPVMILFAVVLLAYGGLTFIDNEFMPGRMRETPAVRPHEKPLLPMKEGVIPYQGGEMLYRAARGVDLKSPLQKDDLTNIQLGKSLYSTYCAQCHGKDHDGNGTVGQSFCPLPTDIRNPQVQSKPDGLLFKEISYGISEPDSRQPPLAGTISVLDRWRIIAYLKSLGPRN
jgi:mono/diheme cytochrome c family protein